MLKYMKLYTLTYILTIFYFFVLIEILKIKDIVNEPQHLAPPGDSVFFHETLRTAD